MKIMIVFYVCLLTIFSQQEIYYNIIDEIKKCVADENIPPDFEEQINFFIQNPVDLNSDSYKDILFFSFLNNDLLNKIIEFRNSGSYYKTKTDFLKIYDKFDYLNLVSQFIVIGDSVMNSERPGLLLRSRFIKKNNSEFYERFDFRSRNIDCNLIYTHKEKTLFNYTLTTKNFLFLEKLILGKFIIDYGYGLSQWGPFQSYYRENDIGNLNLLYRIKPLTSVIETNYLEGILLSFKTSDFLIVPFYSVKADYRTDTSYLAGIILHYSPAGKFQLSVLNRFYMNTYFNSISFIYNDVKHVIKSEISSDLKTFWGKITGRINYETLKTALSIWKLNPKLMGDDYNFPVKDKKSCSEFGIAVSFESRIQKNVILKFYGELSSYRRLVPKNSEYIDVEISYNLSKTCFFSLNYTHTNKENDLKNPVMATEIVKQNKTIISNSLLLNKYIRIFSQIKFNSGGTNNLFAGFGVIQRISLVTGYFNNILGYTYYSTDSYDSRVYFYESDLPGVMNIEMFYNKGFRLYHQLNYNLIQQLIFTMKIFIEKYRKNNSSILDWGYKLQLDYKI